MEEKERYLDLEARVNRFYKGFSAMDVRRCVISSMETQILNMSLRDILEMRRDSALLDIWKLEEESIYAADIRWDKQHPQEVYVDRKVEDVPFEDAYFDDDSNA